MIIPDPTAFLEAEIEAGFPPSHARHYVVTRQEADELGELLGIRVDERARLNLHFALFVTAGNLIGACQTGPNPWPELARAFEQGKGIATATAMRDDADPVRRGAAAAIVGVTSELIPAIEARDAEALLAAMRMVEETGAGLARSMMAGRGRPKAGGQVQPLHTLLRYAAHIARDAGASTALPSNERPDVGTALTDFANALMDKAIERAGHIARHALPSTKAQEVNRFANAARPTARAMVSTLRQALKDPMGEKIVT